MVYQKTKVIKKIKPPVVPIVNLELLPSSLFMDWVRQKAVRKVMEEIDNQLLFGDGSVKIVESRTIYGLSKNSS